MKVRIAVPSSADIRYHDIEEDCSLQQLKKTIQDREGIPPEMQNFVVVMSSMPKNNDWEAMPLIKLFPQSFNVDKNELKLTMEMGPLNGGVMNVDCVFCGCDICHEGNCYCHACGFGTGCVQNYRRIACKCCCANCKCSIM